VREAVVALREDRLVAYAVPQADQSLDAGSLRSFLQQRLPEYMVPSAFVPLETIPLNSSGKVDRKALPAPDLSRSELRATYAAPRNDTEQRLAALWSEVLHVERVGIHDNFFELGGHSLLATQVISRVIDLSIAEVGQAAFELEGVLLNKLFEEPTIAALAESIETIRWAAQGRQAGIDNTIDDLEEIEL
jgi:hypothetical protein